MSAYQVFSIVIGVGCAFFAGHAIAKKEAGWAAFFSGCAVVNIGCAVVNIGMPVLVMAVTISRLS